MAAKASGSGQSGQQIDISQLSAPQLSQLSQQLDQEIEFFVNSMTQLKGAQAKFVESQDCLEKLTPDNKEKDILVPLTSSMYVPGQISDVENVLIDIGTGYFVEKSVADGKDYFKRKAEYVADQIKVIQPVMEEKYKMKQVVTEMLQFRIHAQMKPQQLAQNLQAKS